MEIITLVIYVSTLIVNFVAGRSIGEVSQNYQIDSSPENFTFGIWGLIYIVLSISHVISVINSFRTTYTIPILALITISLNYIFNSAWIFAWSGEKFILSSVFLFLILFTVIFSYILNQNNFEDTFFYYFIQNSFSLYAGWLTAATALNIFIAIFKASGKVDDFSKIGSPVFIGVITAGWTLFNILRERYYDGIGFYLSVGWALFGIYIK